MPPIPRRVKIRRQSADAQPQSRPGPPRSQENYRRRRKSFQEGKSHDCHAARAVLPAGSLRCLPSPVSRRRSQFTPAAKPVVEVAFVLDTTGSMGPLIEGAKRKIWSIATAIVDTNPDAEIRMGLVAYRDIGDEYVTKTFNLTTDIQDLYANLLELRARGGGDWPESVNEALHVGVTKLSWTQGAEICRIMFLVGDAPPHMDYAQDIKYPEVMRMARERDIIVNAVQAGGARDTERVWREIAQLRQRPLHPDPAGRRPDRGDRDAVRHRDHRIAGPHQRHGDPLRPARPAIAASSRRPSRSPRRPVGRLRDGGLSSTSAARAAPAKP